jgi:hypothetical protein
MVDTSPASGPEPEVDVERMRAVLRRIRSIVRLVPFLLEPDPEPPHELDAPDAPGDARPGAPLRP